MTQSLPSRLAVRLDPRPSRRSAPVTTGPVDPDEPLPPDASVAVPRTPLPPVLPGRRNPRWIALGVVAICLGGLLSYVIYARAATTISVVTVAQTVARGEIVEAGDLTTLTLRGGSVPQAIPAAQLPDLVGQRALFDLPAGSIIPSTAIGAQSIPGPGRAVVGLKLADGRVPATLLSPGVPVRLVALPDPDRTVKDKLAGTRFLGSVVNLSPGADGTSSLVNVEVNAKDADLVARLAATDRVALVRESEG